MHGKSSVIELLPITDSGFLQLQQNYFAVAAEGMAGDSISGTAEFSTFVEQQLTAVLDQARGDENTFFHDIVLKKSPTTVGNLWYKLHPKTHFSDMAVISWLGIEPQFRGRGYAKATLRLLSKQLKAAGINKLTLEVFNNNIPAHQLYQAVGFEPQRTVMALSI